MSAASRLEEVYGRFGRIWGNSEPVIDAVSLYAAAKAQGLELAQITDEWLRSLNPEWVYGRADKPFRDESLNQRYHRLVTSS